MIVVDINVKISFRVSKTWWDQARREKASRAKMRWNYFKHTQNIEDGHIDDQWWALVKCYILVD